MRHMANDDLGENPMQVDAGMDLGYEAEVEEDDLQNAHLQDEFHASENPEEGKGVTSAISSTLGFLVPTPIKWAYGGIKGKMFGHWGSQEFAWKLQEVERSTRHFIYADNSFEEAVKLSYTTKKPLLVVCTNLQNSLIADDMRTVFEDDQVHELIEDNFIIYGIDNQHHEFNKFSSRFEIIEIPYFAVFSSVHSPERFSIIDQISEGELTVNIIRSFLRDSMSSIAAKEMENVHLNEIK